MKEDKPSRTARITAAHRAHESQKPVAERVCHDPYARLFVGNTWVPVGQLSLPSKIAFPLWELLMPGWNAYFVARTRFIDDALQTSLSGGLEQLVILGAGYDSRAFRFERPGHSAKVFEVDHPATQQDKVVTLKKQFGSLPSHLHLVPVDFTHDVLADRLLKAGYEPDRRTMFIWEGVSMYLPPGAVDQTLAFVAQQSGRGSSIVFDYTHPDVIDGTCRRREATMWRKSVKRLGEELLFGIQEGAIEKFLKPRGFSVVKNADHAFLKQEYFTGINESRAITPIIEVVHALTVTQN